jgi:hypothetical protein
MARLKQITPADRLAQELLRLQREIDTALREYWATMEPDSVEAPTLRVVDPLQRPVEDKP